jgi:hypothetical protein
VVPTADVNERRLVRARRRSKISQGLLPLVLRNRVVKAGENLLTLHRFALQLLDGLALLLDRALQPACEPESEVELSQ